MQYFVIGPDGSRYGPAEFPLLQQWTLEGRVAPDTMLEDASTMQRLHAAAVPNLFPHQTFAPPVVASQYPNTDSGQVTPLPHFGTAYQSPPTPGQYPRYQGVSETSANATLAWVFFALGIVVCFFSPIFSGLGLWQAIVAEKGGSHGAQTAKICNLVLLIIGGCIWGFYVFAALLAAFS